MNLLKIFASLGLSNLSACTSLYYDKFEEYQGNNYSVLRLNSYSYYLVNQYEKDLNNNCLYIIKENKILNYANHKEKIENGRIEFRVKSNTFLSFRNINGYYNSKSFFAKPKHIYDLDAYNVMKNQIYDVTAKKIADRFYLVSKSQVDSKKHLYSLCKTK